MGKMEIFTFGTDGKKGEKRKNVRNWRILCEIRGKILAKGQNH